MNKCFYLILLMSLTLSVPVFGQAAGQHVKKKATTTISQKTTSSTQKKPVAPKSLSEEERAKSMTGNELYYLAYDYYYGRNSKDINYEKAFNYFRMSGEKGNINGLNKLGEMYENGKGITKNLSLAKYWYQKAADQGHSDAKKNLERLKSAESASSNNNSILNKSGQELFTIGNDYYRGQNGKTKNYTLAAYFFKLSSEKGNSEGQLYYGYMFEKGYGVEQNYIEAFNWYHKSAEQGHLHGQYYLGAMYENGRGTFKDISQAKYWYQKAAAQGQEDAKKRLAVLNSSSTVASTSSEGYIVSGIVVDKKGAPITGASVRVDGTNIGCVTDFGGHFTIKVNTYGKAKLNVSYIGYKKKTVKVDLYNSSNIRVELK